METKILSKLIQGFALSDTELADLLYDICDVVHATCDWECPIYRMQNKVPLDKEGRCPYHKNGQEMLKTLRNYYKYEEAR